MYSLLFIYPMHVYTYLCVSNPSMCIFAFIASLTRRVREVSFLQSLVRQADVFQDAAYI